MPYFTQPTIPMPPVSGQDPTRGVTAYQVEHYATEEEPGAGGTPPETGSLVHEDHHRSPLRR